MKFSRIFLWLNILFLGGCAAIFGGCSSVWDEDVKLSDGREIVVERIIEREGGGDEIALNPSGSKPKLYILKFRDPDNPSEWIEWRSTKFSDMRWPEFPLILDKEQGAFVVYSMISTCAGFLKYRYVDKQWQEEPLPPVFEAIPANLLVHDYEGRPGRVTLEIKKKRNSDVRSRLDAVVGPKIKMCR